MVPLDKGLRWGNVKQKPFRQIWINTHIFLHILTYSDIFRSNQVYSGIIQTYSFIFRTLCNADIFRTLVYSESWHIQNPGVFETLRYSFKTLAQPKPCQTSTMECFQK